MRSVIAWVLPEPAAATTEKLRSISSRETAALWMIARQVHQKKSSSSRTSAGCVNSHRYSSDVGIDREGCERIILSKRKAERSGPCMPKRPVCCIRASSRKTSVPCPIGIAQLRRDWPNEW